MNLSASRALRFFLSSPHGLALALFLAAYGLAVLSLRRYSIRDPGSAFFDPDIGLAPSYSLLRERQAATFIEETDAHQPDPYTPPSSAAYDPTLCIAIPSVQRAGALYLHTAVGSLLAGLTAAERRDLVLLPLLAHTDPRAHAAYNQSWAHALPDRLLSYDGDAHVAAQLRRLAATDVEHRAKSRFDYLHALTACYNATAAPYILMLEDDVLAAQGWLGRLRAALAELEARAGPAGLERTLYVRLFYTELFLGWNSEEWPAYVLGSVAVEAGVAGVLWLVVRRRQQQQQQQQQQRESAASSSVIARFLTRPTMFALLAVAVPACVALYFAAGRCTVQPLAPGLARMDKYGCCSQALLFPRARVPALVEAVRGSSAASGPLKPIDSVIEAYANMHGYARWAVVPALFQHIGGHSSKAKDEDSNGWWGRTKGAVLWNFRYENYRIDKEGNVLEG